MATNQLALDLELVPASAVRRIKNDERESCVAPALTIVAKPTTKPHGKTKSTNFNLRFTLTDPGLSR